VEYVVSTVQLKNGSKTLQNQEGKKCSQILDKYNKLTHRNDITSH